MIRRPGRPIEGSAVHQGSSVTKRIGHVALFVALAVVPVLALNSLATATPTSDGGTDPTAPAPALTDAQRSVSRRAGRHPPRAGAARARRPRSPRSNARSCASR